MDEHRRNARWTAACMALALAQALAVAVIPDILW
jgi:hypothetical protein